MMAGKVVGLRFGMISKLDSYLLMTVNFGKSEILVCQAFLNYSKNIAFESAKIF